MNMKLMPTKHLLKVLSILFALGCAVTLSGQDKPLTAGSRTPAPVAGDFNLIADKALAAMKARAEELNVKGAAVVAYCEGDTVQSWSSKMIAVGHLTSTPSNSPAGENNLAIAYTKAAEMAVTLRDSGSLGRPKMKGENGWQGGVMAKGKTGTLIAAFSGGVSSDDVKVSKAGLEVLAGAGL